MKIIYDHQIFSNQILVDHQDILLNFIIELIKIKSEPVIVSQLIIIFF